MIGDLPQTRAKAQLLAQTLARAVRGAARIVLARVTDNTKQSLLGYVSADYGGNSIHVICRDTPLQVDEWIYVRQVGGERMADWIYVAFAQNATGGFTP